MSIIEPSALPPKLPGSKEIVDEFIESDMDRCQVDPAKLGRSPSSVYVSLRRYLLTRPQLHIKVSQQEGQITLTKE